MLALPRNRNAPQVFGDRQTGCLGGSANLSGFSLRHYKAEDNFPPLAWGFFRPTHSLRHGILFHGIIYTKLIAACQGLFRHIQSQTWTQENLMYFPRRMQGRGFLFRTLAL
jgi:hypothetical protein